tara:strand:- start:148 stop:672 length:525 start_codon:yes stop_codon:yes gene_type:complete
MFNAIVYFFIFSISFLEANNFEKIDLVLSNNYTFKRIKPNDQIIINGANVEYKNINIKNKKIAFISSANNSSIILSYNEIKTLSYQISDYKFLIIGSIFSSGAYALWGYFQSSGNYKNMKDDGAQNRILPFTLGAGIFGGALGIIITYPIQKLYSYKNPIWSEELIIHSDWFIL